MSRTINPERRVAPEVHGHDFRLFCLDYPGTVNRFGLGIPSPFCCHPKTCRVVLLCFSFLFAAVLSRATDRSLEDASSRTIVFRKIAVSGERFDEQYVLQRCREFLAGNKDKTLIRFTLVPDEKVAAIGWTGCDHCKPYPFWRMQYDAIAKEVFPIGEMIVINGNAVLRYRDRNGTVTETVLAGRNPLPVVINDFKGKIVHVGMSGNIVAKNGMPSTLVLELYVVGNGEMSSDAGADYIATFNRHMGVTFSSVDFRSDPWFINEIWRPWFPLFEASRGTPPSEEEFASSKTLNCYMISRRDGTSTNKCSWKDALHLP
jgi:hypothetical protein